MRENGHVNSFITCTPQAVGGNEPSLSHLKCCTVIWTTVIYIYIYIIYSQDTVIDNIIAILYECKMCAV